jgi:hypothetical protein
MERAAAADRHAFFTDFFRNFYNTDICWASASVSKRSRPVGPSPPCRDRVSEGLAKTEFRWAFKALGVSSPRGIATEALHARSNQAVMGAAPIQFGSPPIQLGTNSLSVASDSHLFCDKAFIS